MLLFNATSQAFHSNVGEFLLEPRSTNKQQTAFLLVVVFFNSVVNLGSSLELEYTQTGQPELLSQELETRDNRVQVNSF